MRSQHAVRKEKNSGDNKNIITLPSRTVPSSNFDRLRISKFLADTLSRNTARQLPPCAPANYKKMGETLTKAFQNKINSIHEIKTNVFQFITNDREFSTPQPAAFTNNHFHFITSAANFASSSSALTGPETPPRSQ